MKKRVLSLLLCATMAASFMPPCAEAASSDEKAMGLELLVSAEMAQTDEKTFFLTEPSGLPPTIPDFGFLRELSTPLAVPGENGLMQAVSEPDESAVVITSAEELLAITGGNYRLDRDLDLSGIADWSGINVKSDLILDGQGHRVTGLSGSLFKGQSSNSALTVRNMIVETVEDGIERKGIIAVQCLTDIFFNIVDRYDYRNFGHKAIFSGILLFACLTRPVFWADISLRNNLSGNQISPSSHRP